MSELASLRASYDDIADVLYVVTRAPALDTKSKEVEDGLVLRYDAGTNMPVGATIVDYKGHWLSQKRHLVAELSKFFDISDADARKVISLSR
jgi:uncharacterized protein YuzE